MSKKAGACRDVCSRVPVAANRKQQAHAKSPKPPPPPSKQPCALPSALFRVPRPVGLVGVPGGVGPSGQQGTPGPIGATGQPGPPGIAGPLGPIGATGAPGDAGPLGPQGIPAVPPPTVAFRAVKNLAQGPLGGGSTTTIAFGQEIFDLADGAPADNYDPATSVFTAPVSGVYRFQAPISLVRFLAQTNATFRLVSDSGAPPIERWLAVPVTGATSDSFAAALSGDFLLAAGQTVRAEVSIGGPGSVVIFGITPAPTFTGALVMPVDVV